MRRLAVFAHYDARGVIKKYILRHLEALREVSTEIWFVSTAALPPVELAKAEALCTRAWKRENVGYDFGMWSDALAPMGK